MPTRDTAIQHWPEYLMEAAGLGFFMVSACVFTALFEHPESWIHQQIPMGIIRRVLIGLAMAGTFLAIVFSPWGKRSGAHLNPSVTLNFWLLGKIARQDALFYIAFQFLGGWAGVALASVILGPAIAHESVNYAVTLPGNSGPLVCLAAEFAISFGMMWTVLATSNSRRLSRFTPFFAASLITLYITFEAPLSGTSMNPARTFGSALPAREWAYLWIYFVAPPLAMVTAGQVYRLRHGIHRVFCAKLHHHNDERCIFNCKFGQLFHIPEQTSATHA